jgi:hypothetical protein
MIDAFDKPGSSAAADSAQEGSSGAAARADHKHSREAADANLSSTAGNISQIDIGDTASAGALTTGARADHQHALPTPGAATTSAVADSAAAGTSTKTAAEDHRHGREAFATTSDIADVAATESAGTAATVPHGDHTHALPALAAWTSYNPVWSSSGTAPSLQNGTLTGAYVQFGKTVHFRLAFTAGSSTTFGTGNYAFTLPPPAANTAQAPIGYGVVVDAGVGRYLAVAFLLSGTAFNMVTQPTTGLSSVITNTSPITFGNADAIFITGTYEAA